MANKKNQKVNIISRAAAFLAGICKNHTGKMEGMQSFSTSCKTNKFCQVYSKNPSYICSSCYAQSQLSYQHTTDNKCQRNEDIVKGSLIPDDELPEIKAPLFRWESFGDIDDVWQAANYLRISAHNPGVLFGWWTKNPFIIKMALEMFNLEKPANLTIIASSKVVNQIDHNLEKYDFVDHIFTVFDADYIEEHNVEINCGARCCATCQKCYNPARNAPYYISEKKK